ELEPASHAQRGRAAEQAAALVGELECAVDERHRLVQLEPRRVGGGETLGDQHLEVLALGVAGGRERELREPLELVGVAEPDPDLRRDPERLEAVIWRLLRQYVDRLRSEA